MEKNYYESERRERDEGERGFHAHLSASEDFTRDKAGARSWENNGSGSKARAASARARSPGGTRAKRENGGTSGHGGGGGSGASGRDREIEMEREGAREGGGGGGERAVGGRVGGKGGWKSAAGGRRERAREGSDMARGRATSDGHMRDKGRDVNRNNGSRNSDDCDNSDIDSTSNSPSMLAHHSTGSSPDSHGRVNELSLTSTSDKRNRSNVVLSSSRTSSSAKATKKKKAIAPATTPKGGDEGLPDIKKIRNTIHIDTAMIFNNSNYSTGNYGGHCGGGSSSNSPKHSPNSPTSNPRGDGGYNYYTNNNGNYSSRSNNNSSVNTLSVWDREPDFTAVSGNSSLNKEFGSSMRSGAAAHSGRDMRESRESRESRDGRDGRDGREAGSRDTRLGIIRGGSMRDMRDASVSGMGDSMREMAASNFNSNYNSNNNSNNNSSFSSRHNSVSVSRRRSMEREGRERGDRGDRGDRGNLSHREGGAEYYYNNGNNSSRNHSSRGTGDYYKYSSNWLEDSEDFDPEIPKGECVCACLSVFVCMCVSVCLSVFVCMWCLSLCAFLSLCVYLPLCVCFCLSMSVCVCPCICVSV